jgi:phosphate-selective porin OprO/OprP
MNLSKSLRWACAERSARCPCVRQCADSHRLTLGESGLKRKLGIVAAAIVAASVRPALADSASTLGGIVVRSDDGNFVASLGGRVHFDYTGIMPDKGSGFDSGAAENVSGFYFRRVYISLVGKIYGWRYRIDEDIANTSNPANGLQDVFASHDIGDYGTVRIGQTKPYRSMEELISNNDKIFTERNVNSATGLLGGRDYQEGVFYRYSRPATFKSNDHFWGGVSIYSLTKAGAPTGQGTGTPTQGIGYNGRLTYAPILTERRWVHIGASYSSDHADNGARLTSGDSVWYSYKGVTQNLVSMAGVQPATTPSGAHIGGGNNPDVTTLAGELAGAFGPVYLQSEYGSARFHQGVSPKAGVPNDQTVTAYCAEVSFYPTGESKRYDTTIASYASPKPLHDYGAVEVAVGYNFIKNRDIPAGDTGAVCAPALGSIPAGSHITRCELSYITAGINYSPNYNVRFMLDYNYATFDLGNAGKDRPKAVNGRFQIWF